MFSITLIRIKCDSILELQNRQQTVLSLITLCDIETAVVAAFDLKYALSSKDENMI